MSATKQKQIHVFYCNTRLRALAERHFRRKDISVVCVDDYDIMSETMGLPPNETERERYLRNTVDLDTKAYPNRPVVVFACCDAVDTVGRALPHAKKHRLREIDEDDTIPYPFLHIDQMYYVNEQSLYSMLDERLRE